VCFLCLFYDSALYGFDFWRHFLPFFFRFFGRLLIWFVVIYLAFLSCFFLLGFLPFFVPVLREICFYVLLASMILLWLFCCIFTVPPMADIFCPFLFPSCGKFGFMFCWLRWFFCGCFAVFLPFCLWRTFFALFVPALAGDYYLIYFLLV
jgi:hypothetical protein